jgi:hypothetical protein
MKLFFNFIKSRSAVVFFILTLAVFIGGFYLVKAIDPVSLEIVANANNLEVKWKTPENAVKQEVRYSASPIDISNYDSASVALVPEVAPGQKQTVKIGNLKENVTYYVAYKYFEIDKSRTEQHRLENKISQKNASQAKAPVALDADITSNSSSNNKKEAQIDYVQTDNANNSNQVITSVDLNDIVYKTNYVFASATTADKDTSAPKAVKDLSFTSTADSITISWTAPTDSDLDSYLIKYNTSEITQESFASDGLVSNAPVGLPGMKQQVTVSGLKRATIYYFAVVAKDFSNNLSAMEVVKTGTEGIVVLHAQPSVNAVTLMWLTTGDTISHEMRYSTQPIDSNNYASASLVSNFPGVIPDHQQMVTVSQLTPFTTYYFAYRYQVSGGVWQMSTVSAKTLNHDNGAPNPVTNLSLIAQQNNIYLSWQSPDNVDLAGFHVRYAKYIIDQANFHTAFVANNTPIGQPNAVQSMVIANLSVNTRYYVAIVAVDTSGNESMITTATTVTGNIDPSGIGFVAVPSVNAITAFWLTPQNIIDYQVRYSINPINASNFNLASLAIAAPAPIASQLQNVTIAQLSPGTHYYLVYRANTASGVVYYNTEVNTLIHDVIAPAPITFFSLSPQTNSITLRWTSPSDTDLVGFHVRYATYELNSNNFTSGQVANNTPIGVPDSDQTMIISNLDAGTTYWVGIMAVDASGNESPLRVNAVQTLSSVSSGGGLVVSNGGNGGGAVFYGAFIGPYTIKINNDQPQSFSRNVNLNIDCGGNVRAMAVSNLADLSGAQVVPYQTTYPWTLASGNGIKTVYLRCYGYEGLQSPIVSDSVELISGESENIPEQIVAPQVGQVLGVKIHPDNTLVRTPDERVYLISNGGKKTRVISVFDLYYRFKGQPIENITFAELEQYPDLNKNVLGARVFSNGTLIRAQDYRVYVIVNGSKKYLPTLEDVRAYKGKKIINVNYEDLSQYPTIYEDTARHNNLTIREGSLVRDSNGQIFVIRNGQRHYIPGYAEVFERYANVPIINVDEATLAKYPLDGPYPHTGKAQIGLGIYPNGTLIRTPDGKVYEVNDGFGDVVSLADLKGKLANRNIINVNQYFAIPSPKPLY